MFCTGCGTQVEQGKNFCRNCGASLAKSTPEAGSMKTAEQGADYGEKSQSLPISPARDRRDARRLVFTAVGVAALIAVGVGIYLGSGLFGENADPENSPGAGEMTTELGKSPEAPEAPKNEVSGSGERSAESALLVPPGSEEAEAPPSKAAQSPPSRAESSMPRESKQSPAPSVRKAPSRPPPAAGGAPESTAKAVSPAAIPGTYQIIRPTRVHERPSATSKVVASIDDGVRVNVVGSTGEWLEVRSRTGNPPGFIRREDAFLLE